MNIERIAVTVEPSPAYELLMSLSAMADTAEREGYEIGADWFERAQDLAGVDLVERVARLTAGCSWVFGNLLGLAIETPEPRDGAAFLDHLRRQNARRLHLVILGHTLRPFRRIVSAEMLERAVDGDPVARAEVMQRSFPEHPTWPAAVRGILAMTSSELQALLLGIVADWEARVFRVLGRDLVATAARDAIETRALQGTMPPAQLIELVTRGWDYAPEPGVSRVILAPSVVGRPWVTTADHGDTRIFCYAVSDAVMGAAAADDPPAFLVRRLRALGDERRLRLLKRIVAGRPTLNELSHEMELPKTTLHHHLAILRAAGLIRLRHDPGVAYSPYPRYTLRTDAVPGAFGALEAWLAAPHTVED